MLYFYKISTPTNPTNLPTNQTPINQIINQPTNQPINQPPAFLPGDLCGDFWPTGEPTCDFFVLATDFFLWLGLFLARLAARLEQTESSELVSSDFAIISAMWWFVCRRRLAVPWRAPGEIYLSDSKNIKYCIFQQKIIFTKNIFVCFFS